MLYLSEDACRSTLSGAELHVHSLLLGLEAAGHDAELVAMLWTGSPSAELRSWLSSLTEANVTVTTIEAHPGTTALSRWSAFLRAWVALWRLLRARRDRVVHIHLDLVITPMLALFARCRRIALSVHNDEPRYRSWPWRIWLTALSYLPISFIAITEHVRRHLDSCQIGSRHQAARVVYYGFPPPESHQEDPALVRSQYDLPMNRFVIGFIGRLAPQKQVHLLIDAVAHRPEALLVIIGSGSLRSQLERQAQSLHADVRFLGSIPEAGNLIRMFDLFCLPSRWEGLGVVLIEAMMREVPVIGSNRGAIPEVLGYGEYGLLFEPTTESLVAALDKVRSDPDSAKKRAETAARYAAERFSIARMVREMSALYLEIAPETRSEATSR